MDSIIQPVCVVLLGTTAASDDDSLITSVPGFAGVIPSKHYAGYVKIHGRQLADAGEKNLFYYFVESERNPSTDPVVLWLNGGPGCSSFYGFVYEHGPFRFRRSSKSGSSLPRLSLNPYSWSKVSNILYLDSPCGVGLSYSDDPNNYVTGDLQTASDSHAFLLKWFKLYPQFLSNPFYISGESYAGVYVPTLASNVVKGIKSGAKPFINFKGYLVGNGVVDDSFDGYNAHVPFAYGMGLISTDIYEDMERTCKGNYSEPIRSLNCSESIQRGFEALGDINWYNILVPVCYSYPSSSSSSWVNEDENAVVTANIKKQQKKKRRMTRMNSGHRWSMRSLNRDGRVPLTSSEATTASHDPCFLQDDDLATAWLNDENVRKAIHAAPSNIAGAWEICSRRVNYTTDIGTMIPYHINLTTQGYRALIYSGDHDFVVPFTGTQAWTRSLGYKIIEPWRSWLSNTNQVAGYLQGYDKDLTFLTIKGAGHMVPQDKPMEALTFYSRWLGGKSV